MSRSSGPRLAPDFASFLGILIGLGGILGGLLLEGGNLHDISQITGGIIVLGGTLGAVMLTTPMAILVRAFGKLRLVFFEPRYSVDVLIEDLLEYGNRARRNGIVSLEHDVTGIRDPFLSKALALGVDGTDLADLRKIMELDLDMEADMGKADAKVYECAGGYSPTIGIIGAVLGLIQVMKNLQDIDAVGHGIAVAFVATVYGVGLANLFFLPAAAKIRNRVDQAVRMKELMLEGVCSIVQGQHPKLIEQKLESFAQRPARNGTERGGGRVQRAAA